MNDAYYRLNEPHVVGELLDGELIVVAFETGCYFSIRGVGADTCALLTSGRSLGEVEQAIAAHHQRDPSQTSAEIQQFVQQLLEEQILVEGLPANGVEKPVVMQATSYEPPTFEKFDDMADQLLLDPIHDLDETGWPTRPA